MSEQTEQPEPLRCECKACWFDDDAGIWHWQIGPEASVPLIHTANGTHHAHCPGSCGCRLSVDDGEPVVGKSVAALLEEFVRHPEVAYALTHQAMLPECKWTKLVSVAENVFYDLLPDGKLHLNTDEFGNVVRAVNRSGLFDYPLVILGSMYECECKDYDAYDDNDMEAMADGT